MMTDTGDLLLFTWFMRWSWFLWAAAAVTGLAGCCSPHDWWLWLPSELWSPPRLPPGCVYPAPLCSCSGHCGTADDTVFPRCLCVRHCDLADAAQRMFSSVGDQTILKWLFCGFPVSNVSWTPLHATFCSLFCSGKRKMVFSAPS